MQPGPWGGGNQAMTAMVGYLREHAVEVSFDLAAPDLDLILLTDPRSQLRSCAYTDVEIARYLRTRNRRAIVVHRINECDERKGTQGLNARLIRANACADHTVFVSGWLRDLFAAQGLHPAASSVIHNGSDRAIFNPGGYTPWDGKGVLRLVTHHWGAHWLKGFDIYQRVDDLLEMPRYRDRISFTYIGQLPKGVSFRNAAYVEPLHGKALADELRKHHVYLTGSQFEPGGNHQNEGANCGLPLLYRESGCMPEYCEGFGVSYVAENFEEKLEEMMERYGDLVGRMGNFPNTSGRMCEAYFRLFSDLVARREHVLAARHWSRRVGLRLWSVLGIGTQ